MKLAEWFLTASHDASLCEQGCHCPNCSPFKVSNNLHEAVKAKKAVSFTDYRIVRLPSNENYLKRTGNRSVS
jgi:hypothetical protein